MTMPIAYRDTAIGVIGIYENDGNIENLYFQSSTVPLEYEQGENELIETAFGQLAEYLAGKRNRFDLPLAPKGTEFQRKCWNALLEIPYGETASYGEIAEKIGSPKGFRAVGLANNRNPIAIFIPCHRVVGANGALTGFAGGLGVKQKLLDLEKAHK